MLKKISSYESEVRLAASANANGAEFSIECIVQVRHANLAKMYIYLL